MNKRIVFSTIGVLLMLLATTFVAPLLVSFSDPEPARSREMLAFGATIAVTAGFGALLHRISRCSRTEIGTTEGFAVVSIAWVAVGFFGSLPFVFSGSIPSLVDAFYETVSGFTTTGSSMLSDVETLPRGIVFWRSFTHWLGGMGIVLLSIAILPAMGAGGAQLYNAEVSGISGERLTPRIAETAKLLWKVYLLLTVLLIILLCAGGMNLFDAACHTFGTMGTGGYSTKNASIGHYGSAYIEWVIVVFMFLAGCNFMMHFQLLRGRVATVLRNAELRLFVIIIVVATGAIALSLAYSPPSAWAEGERLEGYDSAHDVMRRAAFQAASIVTTTGFATADFDRWPDLCRFVLFLLMFIGGCGGSTSGSMKVGRVLILLHYAWREVRRLARPHAIFHIRLDGQAIDRNILDNVIGLCWLFVLTFVIGTLALLGIESAFAPADSPRIDFVTAASAVATNLGGVGPGFNRVGPTVNFGWMTDGSKLLLSLVMILGRLELYSVFVLLSPRVWRR